MSGRSLSRNELISRVVVSNNSIIGTIFDPIVSHALNAREVLLSGSPSSPELFVDGLAPGTAGLSVEQDLVVGTNGRMYMASLGNTANPKPAIIDIAEGQLHIDATAQLVGNGELNFGFRPSTDPLLVNNGLLHVRDLSPFLVIPGNAVPSKLTITGFSSNQNFDLDGVSDTGDIHIDNRATLELKNGLSDAFNGTLTLDSESAIDIVSFPIAEGEVVVNTTPGEFETGPPGFNAAVIRGGFLNLLSATLRLDDAANDRLRIESFASFLKLSGAETGTTVENRGILTLAGGGQHGPETTINLTGSDSELVITGPEVFRAQNDFLSGGSGQFRVAEDGSFEARSSSDQTPTVDARFRNEGLVRLSSFSPTNTSSLVVADYVQTPSATLSVFGEVGFNGVSFARLESTGDIELAGKLLLDRESDFLPNVGFERTIVDADGMITGTFDSVDATAYADLGLGVELDYFLRSIRVRFVELAFAADLDSDGDVDGNDFLLIQRTDTSLIPSWEMQYGSSGSSANAVAVVPEPSTPMFALFLAALVGRRRHSLKNNGGELMIG